MFIQVHSLGFLWFGVGFSSTLLLSICEVFHCGGLRRTICSLRIWNVLCENFVARAKKERLRLVVQLVRRILVGHESFRRNFLLQ